MNCHQEDGSGVGKLVPRIDKQFMEDNMDRLGCILKYGMNEPIVINGNNHFDHMPGNSKISDFDIVNLLNYINEEFGDGSKTKFNIEDLRENLKTCKEYRIDTE